jgi:hypothetical protein
MLQKPEATKVVADHWTHTYLVAPMKADILTSQLTTLNSHRPVA